MTPATAPLADRTAARLLRIDPRAGRFAGGRVRDLPGLLQAGDLLVLNDAATLPGSLAGWTVSGEPVEIRLAAGPAEGGLWRAAILGAGDWRRRTEDRPRPPPLPPGAAIRLGSGLVATVQRLSDISPRLVDLSFDETGAALYEALYAAGRPTQYSYLARPLELWDVQTAFATRPFAFEPPSAGLPLSFGLLSDLRRRGVRIAALTHAAGLSSTGDPAIDAALPLAERYEIPEATAAAVASVHAAGRRVVAAGTTVVRALEAAFERGRGRVLAGTGEAALRLGPDRPPALVDGLLTGMHEPGTSHHDLLSAFVPAALLAEATAHAERAGYRGHEFGDATLVLGDYRSPDRLEPPARP